ncbi:MAG: transporter related protein [Pseudonocardiales bacterium]|nr:transporter related protein [Pseudonocardiales bacterium]
MSVVLRTTSLYRFCRTGDPEAPALRGAALAVEAGEIVAVVGSSGSGTSTLMSCLAGIDDPDGGIVSVAGHRLSHRPEAEKAALRAAYIGLVSHSRNLFAHLTVQENMELCRHLSPRRPRRRRRVDLLAALGIEHRGAAYPRELSGGELARAALAVALANHPKLLLADEPTGELDRAAENAALELVRNRAADGMAVVVASHSPAVLQAADRVLSMVDGAFRH